MRDAVICEPFRTAVGDYCETLRDVPVAELAATPILGKNDPDATVMAGNVCGRNDAAAACIVTTREMAEKLGLQP